MFPEKPEILALYQSRLRVKAAELAPCIGRILAPISPLFENDPSDAASIATSVRIE
jgi:hypothetical protein